MESVKNPFLLIIYGPTGVGKTDFALNIAKHIPAEIINMDVGQFYTPLTIGTAKPDWRSSEVTHHLFDILPNPKNYTVTDYRTSCLEAARKIARKGKLPILVGGSGFYLKSLFFPPAAPSPQKNIQTSTEDYSWDALYNIDPERAQLIEKHDTYRINRALKIWYETGVKPSECVPSFESPGPFHLVFLQRDRKELYERINARVVAMLKEGWLEETIALKDSSWEQFIKEKKIIGYNEILDYFAGDRSDLDFKNMVSLIQKRTRNYAKRQFTFWRMLEKSLKKQVLSSGDDQKSFSQIEAVDLTLAKNCLYINQLSQQLSLKIMNMQ
jgi:tRNA dimethylallyltransferase